MSELLGEVGEKALLEALVLSAAGDQVGAGGRGGGRLRVDIKTLGAKTASEGGLATEEKVQGLRAVAVGALEKRLASLWGLGRKVLGLCRQDEAAVRAGEDLVVAVVLLLVERPQLGADQLVETGLALARLFRGWEDHVVLERLVKNW